MPLADGFFTTNRSVLSTCPVAAIENETQLLFSVVFLQLSNGFLSLKRRVRVPHKKQKLCWSKE